MVMAQLASNVYQIDGVAGANAFLLVGETLTLVDTGWPGNGRAIGTFVQTLGRQVREITRLLVTHAHPDHAGSLAELQRLTGAKVYAHPAEAAVLSGAIPLPLPPRAVRRLIGPLEANDPLPAVNVDRELTDGLVLDGGVRVLHTPGHTRGSVSFLVEESGVLLAGDLFVQTNGRLHVPPASFHEDAAQARASVRRLADLEFDILGCGHGPPVLSGAAARVWNLLL